MLYYYFTNELYHHGIKGQRWGVRRYQNPDGSYTPAGAERYNDRNTDDSVKQTSKIDKRKVAKRVAIGAAVVGGTILAIANRKET